MGGDPGAAVDDAGDRLVAPAVELVSTWLVEAERSLDRGERADAARFAALTADPASVDFTMAFADRVMRPEDDAVAAAQLRDVSRGRLPRFLSTIDRLLVHAGGTVSRAAPGVVIPLARRRLRSIVGRLVAERDDPALHDHLEELRAAGFDVNANLLGEYVLGDREALRRLDDTIALIHRPDVSYVSVKASSVAAQINLWDHEATVERIGERLRRLYVAAAAHQPPKFVNLDMEEFKDLALTVDAFTAVLGEHELTGLSAGIVLQAYLPDSVAALEQLTAWALRRRAAGGAPIKIRLVKGANLAMERVDAALHGWQQAPYPRKADTDANYKRLVDLAFDPARTDAVRIGLASHNLFDVAWAKLLAQARGVSAAVEFEMLQGMAPGIARTVRDATGSLLLYTPIVPAADFDTALAYLFRRLEENSSGENFLAHMAALHDDAEAFAAERQRFEEAVGARWSTPATSRRHAAAPPPAVDGPFANVADSDPTDPVVRAAVRAALADAGATPPPDPPVVDERAGIDRAVAAAVDAHRSWAATPAAERRRVLRAVAAELDRRRPELLAVMAVEAGKTLAEGDGEVSEAVDYAAFYADRCVELDGHDAATFAPLGVVAVVPPWNFPLAIPAGGVLAALAAGNSVILKPAPQTPRTASALAEACWAAGVPRGALQYVRCPDGAIGEHLIGHRDVAAIVLTGAYETAELFTRLAPGTPLFAETSGKNAIVIMPDADLDLAVADLVRSAFGHAGQKCSAASLAILVGSVGRSDRLRRQLIDATTSLVVGPSTDPASIVGPLIEPASGKLARALAQPDEGQHWLLEPRRLDGEGRLWTPGILEGVRPGSWFHVTECFGPVLGLMAAADLDEALRFQNAVPFGLTGGIHSLDDDVVDAWLERVEVGNAYVNRGITGAIVRRQPFGGWKRSSVGPAAKAGGPNYVAELGRWADAGVPAIGAEPDERLAALAAQLSAGLADAERLALDAAVRSDAHWWATEFAVEHDPTGLFCEANVFRYRPLADLVVRIAGDASALEVARVLCAVERSGSPVTVSVAPGYSGPLGDVDHVRASDQAFAASLAGHPPARIRVLGSVPVPDALPAATYLDRRPVVLNGRIELARYLREQAVSRTLHRFGNIVGHGGGFGAAVGMEPPTGG